MNIKDVIKTSALLLNREDVVNYLNLGQGDLETLSTVNKLTSLVNLVISELASTYVPMIKVEQVVVKNGNVLYTNLSERVLGIVDVRDTNNVQLNFEVKANGIEVKAERVVVEYEFLPPNFDLGDIVNFSNARVDERVLSYGLIAEFCITEGRFEEAVTWHKRFVEELSLICCPKNVNTKQRRWA